MKQVFRISVFTLCLTAVFAVNAPAQEEFDIEDQLIFDDTLMLDGYAQKYQTEDKDILLAIIQDETLSAYKTAAAVRVFRQRFAREVVSGEKRAIEKFLFRKLNRTDSPFVQVEIMHTLCVMDRYKYFKPMVPALIQKLDHYNRTVNQMAYRGLEEIAIKNGHNRAREARIVFNILRKVLFLSRKRLETMTEPTPLLKQKLDLLRWSIKILGTEELKRLPNEVLHLF